MSKLDERFKAIKDLSEDYESTVHALLAFSAFIVHDGKAVRPGSHYGFGRRMETSEQNVVAASRTITPDLAAQKSDTYGIVAEVKNSLPREVAHWDDEIEQVRKYDDRLIGWWTTNESIAASTAVLLMHHSRSRAFTRHLQQRINENSGLLNSAALVEYGRSEQAATYIFFRREWGAIPDNDLGPKLDDGIQVPLDKVLRSFSNIRFYDSPPPLPWLLTMLWTDMFPALKDLSQYDVQLKATPIDVSIEMITTELQQAYGSLALEQDHRSAQFPKQTWVRQALEALVDAKLALRRSNPGDYTVLYRTFREDVLRRLVALTEKLEEKKQPAQVQLPLPFPLDAGELPT